MDATIVLPLTKQIRQGLGLSEEEVIASRQEESSHTKIVAGLVFDPTIIGNHGSVSDEDYKLAQQADYSAEEIIEIIGQVAENLFANYFNQIVQTAIDFSTALHLKKE